MMKKVFLIISLFAFASMTVINAQVTIGNGEAPIAGAILQLKTINETTSNGGKNATQGLAFPRVELVKKDQLQPMYSATESASLSNVQKMAHKGLTVFNVNEVSDEDLAVGLNFWNGEEWIAVSEPQRKSEVAVYCNRVRSYGRYVKGAPLTGDHYIIFPVDVEKKGDYTITASSSNGYYFQASGVFETTGNVEVKLTGMGTPGEVGTDVITFTNNGEPVKDSNGSACNTSITVTAASLAYRINDCESIQVFGDYPTRKELQGYYNYAEIPVEVISVGTTPMPTQWETPLVNGVKFIADQTFSNTGEAVLTIKAQGVPMQSGTFTFPFITDGDIRNQCSFTVQFTSTLGSFNDPACKCMDIYKERPDATNGEYFLLDCLGDGQTIKTYCDIVNGGYTLVWSFSEKTAYEDYSPAGMAVTADYRFERDVPINPVTTENGTIDYTNYRLSRDHFRHFPNSTTNPTLKVRICEKPTDMNDPWGLNNYGIISPQNVVQNPIESILGPLQVPSVGKVFGKNWEQKRVGGGAYGGWDEVSGNHHIALYSNTLYPTHWDWGYSAPSTTLFEVVPDKGGADNRSQMDDFNNTFGWWGESGPNHHFGKCGRNSDDYDFSTPVDRRCSGDAAAPSTGTAYLYPHSFNNGEGRYLQWFVK